MSQLRIYLDVCCLNRPFDDLSQDRVHFESDAVLTILSRCESGEWLLVSSEVIDLEFSKSPDLERLKKVRALYSVSQERLILNGQAEVRAKEFQKHGIKVMDSLHLAVAESGQVDVLLTTDDIFLRKAKNLKLNMVVANPVTWLMEVLLNER